MSLRPSSPFSCEGQLRETINRATCNQVQRGLIGVRTFIPYALPAIFDISAPKWRVLIFHAWRNLRRSFFTLLMRISPKRSGLLLMLSLLARWHVIAGKPILILIDLHSTLNWNLSLYHSSAIQGNYYKHAFYFKGAHLRNITQ